METHVFRFTVTGDAGDAMWAMRGEADAHPTKSLKIIRELEIQLDIMFSRREGTRYLTPSLPRCCNPYQYSLTLDRP